MQRFAPPSEPRARGDASPLLDRVVLAVALLYTLAYTVVALLRMPYPFELEWMEGGMLTQVQRVLHGQPIYTAPSLSYIPFDYTPLYFLVAALPARWMGEGFTALRLLSFAASLGCFGLVFALVWRQTASGSAAAIATGSAAAIAAGHSIDPSLVARFWIQDLLAPLALATMAGAAFLLLPAPEGRPRARGFHVAVAAGLVGSAWWLRMFPGSYDNALMPAYAGVAFLAGCGWHALREHFATSAPPGPGPDPKPAVWRGAARRA